MALFGFGKKKETISVPVDARMGSLLPRQTSVEWKIPAPVRIQEKIV